MRFLFLSRSPLYWVRLFLFSYFICSCRSKDYEIIYQEPPLQDFEASEVSLYVQRPSEKAEIRASDYSEIYNDRIAIVSGNVRILLRDLADVITAKFNSDFLKIDRKKRKWILKGNVSVQMHHDIFISSDSLIWDIERNRLKIPDTLSIEHSRGEEKGINFDSNLSSETWQYHDVSGYWVSRDFADSVQVRAVLGQGHILRGNLQVFYFDAGLKALGMELFGSKAHCETESSLLTLSGGVRGVDGIINFAAEQMEVNLREHRIVANGSVSIERDSVSLTADIWREDRILKETELWGLPAHFYRGTTNIQGRRLNYKQGDDILFVDSTAVFEDAEYYIAAQKMSFDAREQILTATSDVEIRDNDLDGVLTGKYLTLDQRNESGRIYGNPRLIFVGKDLVFRADSIAFDGLLNQVTMMGDVFFENRSLRVESEEAIVSADGAQVVFYHGIQLKEKAKSNNYSYQMVADTLSVDLVEGEFTQADLNGYFKVNIETVSEDMGLILGSEGSINFSKGNLTAIELNKDSEFEYKGLEMPDGNRFKGEKMKLSFDNQGLSQVFVEGDAQFISQLNKVNKKRAVNHIFAEEINVRYKNGEIDNIFIGPSVQGIYTTGNEARK